MYSPVFLSWPTTSGSPPVLSISFSDHSFSVFASSFACNFAQSKPLWRFIFFSKRAFNALRSSSPCCGENSFFISIRLAGRGFETCGGSVGKGRLLGTQRKRLRGG